MVPGFGDARVNAVLLQIDPAKAAEALGSGDTKYILAAGLVFFAVVAVTLGKMLYTEIKACAAQTLDITQKNIVANHRIADVMEAAMQALKKP